MKAVQERIEVTTTPLGQPLLFLWRSRCYVVQVLDAWRYGGRWWLSERPRDCFLVQAGTLTAELHHDIGGGWWLARLQD